MKDTENLHLKVQELCNCYSTTDPLKEMSEMQKGETGPDEALKWIALAILHGVNSDAKKISIKQGNDGKVSVTAAYKDTSLPSPGDAVGADIIDTVKKITHIEDDKGKIEFAVGISNSSLDLKISVKKKADYQKISIKF